jgi:hypothetical protein
MDDRITLSGGCHCGAVRFEADVVAPVALLDCNCSMCARTGYLHLIVDEAAFRLLTPADALAEYRFGTGAARHLFCKTCGIKSFYKPRSHPDGWSVNWRCLDSTAGIEPRIDAFDGRGGWEAARAALD